MNKRNFVWLGEWTDLTADFTTDQLGTLLRMVQHHVDGQDDKPTKDKEVTMAYRFIVGAVDRSMVKYEEICQKRADAARKKAEKQKQANADKSMQMQANGGINNPNPNPNPNHNPNPNPNPTPHKGVSVYSHAHGDDGFKIFGIFQNVRLTDSDLDTIRMNFATEGLDDTFLNRCVDKLSSYMAQNGTHYTNHAAAILSWVKAAVLEEDRRTGKAQPKPAAYSSKTVSPEAEHERKVRELKQLWDAMSEEDKRITIELEGMPMYENPKYIERQ